MRINEITLKECTVAGGIAPSVVSTGPLLKRTTESEKAKYKKTPVVRNKNVKR